LAEKGDGLGVEKEEAGAGVLIESPFFNSRKSNPEIGKKKNLV